MFKPVTLLAVAAVFAMSCSAPQTPQTKTGPFTYGIVTLDTPIAYTFYASSSHSDGFDSTGSTRDTLVWPSLMLATAYFNDTSSASSSWLSAGTVTFNGTGIPLDSGNVYFSQSAPVYFDGRYQPWNIQGSGTVPAISDSLEGPYDSVTIASPTVAANVSEDSNLTITWNTGNSSETTMLMIIPSGGAQGSSASGQGYYDEISGASGSYIIPSVSLSQIPKGHATISISRGVYKIGRASNGQNYVMVSWSNDARDINLY